MKLKTKINLRDAITEFLADGGDVTELLEVTAEEIHEAGGRGDINDAEAVNASSHVRGVEWLLRVEPDVELEQDGRDLFTALGEQLIDQPPVEQPDRDAILREVVDALRAADGIGSNVEAMTVVLELGESVEHRCKRDGCGHFESLHWIACKGNENECECEEFI